MFALFLSAAVAQIANPACAAYQNQVSDLEYLGLGDNCRAGIESAWPGGKTCASPYIICLPQENTAVYTLSKTHKYSLGECKEECAVDQRCLGFEFIADSGTNVGKCNLLDDIPPVVDAKAGVNPTQAINEADADLSAYGAPAICYQKSAGSCNPYFKASQLTQQMLDCYCPNNRKGFYQKNVERTVAGSVYCGTDNGETARIQQSHANRMFHLCENWCLFNTIDPNAEMWYYDPWQKCFREQISGLPNANHTNYCYNVIADPYTIEIQFINLRATKFCAVPLGPVVPGKGCSNTADIMLTPPGEIAGVADADACRQRCDDYGAACDGAQFTTGWIAWGPGQTSGGFTNVVDGADIRSLLATTCKLVTCSDCSSSTCSAAGTNGCKADSSCVSVGPAGAGCGGTISDHLAKAIECVTSSGASIGTINVGNSLTMDTGSVKCPSATSSCGHSQDAYSCFGPYQDSDVFHADAGDIISWNYKAQAGGDWFEVMVVIYRGNSAVAIPTFRNGNAMSSFRTDSWTVDTTASDYKIRFIVGSYDRTGGTVLGGSMEVASFGRTDSQGNGITKCVLLGEGCNEVTIAGVGGLALRQ